jgi:hypothetical protein
MLKNLREMAKKAMGGDSEAMELVIIAAPKGSVGDDPMEFLKKVVEDGEYGGELERAMSEDDYSGDYEKEGEGPDSKQLVYEAKHKAVMEALDMAGVARKEASDIADKVCADMDMGMDMDEPTSEEEA